MKSRSGRQLWGTVMLPTPEHHAERVTGPWTPPLWSTIHKTELDYCRIQYMQNKHELGSHGASSVCHWYDLQRCHKQNFSCTMLWNLWTEHHLCKFFFQNHRPLCLVIYSVTPRAPRTQQLKNLDRYTYFMSQDLNQEKQKITMAHWEESQGAGSNILNTATFPHSLSPLWLKKTLEFQCFDHLRFEGSLV